MLVPTLLLSGLLALPIAAQEVAGTPPETGQVEAQGRERADFGRRGDREALRERFERFLERRGLRGPEARGWERDGESPRFGGERDAARGPEGRRPARFGEGRRFGDERERDEARGPARGADRPRFGDARDAAHGLHGRGPARGGEGPRFGDSHPRSGEFPPRFERRREERHAEPAAFERRGRDFERERSEAARGGECPHCGHRTPDREELRSKLERIKERLREVGRGAGDDREHSGRRGEERPRRFGRRR